jgi:antitoxin VapB
VGPVRIGESLYILSVHILGVRMSVTKVFRSGNSQAVRIPREYQFDTAEVEIERRGEEIVLRPPRRNLRSAFDALSSMPDDFFAAGRDDGPAQVREGL